jgi:hypothetical protein
MFFRLMHSCKVSNIVCGSYEPGATSKMESGDMCTFSSFSYIRNEMAVDDIYSWERSGLLTKE